MLPWKEFQNSLKDRSNLWNYFCILTLNFSKIENLRLLFIIISLLQIIYGFSQTVAPQIVFDAKITSVENQGEKIDIVKVYVSRNKERIDSTITENGRFYFTLDTGYVYKVEFKKTGYESKHLIVSTKEAPKDVKQRSKLKVEVSLFKAKADLDVDFLKSKPIGIARYNYINSKLEWDKDYTRMMIEKIISATLDHYDKTHPDE